MDMKNFTVWFSRERLGGLFLAATTLTVLQAAPAMAESFSGTFSGPSESVTFSSFSGPRATLNMPTLSVTSVDPTVAIDTTATDSAANPTGDSMLGGSLGATGTQAYTSYKTGEAPEDAGMSGLTSSNTSNPQQTPTMGPGSNVGFSQMTNGLMAPFSVNPQQINQFDGLGYGFNMNPQTQVYSMATGINALIDTAINTFGGGIVTTGPVLPVTSTGSVNANVTLGNGY